ncbi:hypothetical protein [Mycetohabitans endofungorum]|uniref:hypothetical protein n=1 Tax=Mycetohabitans endofungorum TaxID=417203 RepID=UPI002B05D740|nr:hypothetical protein [Mycetohabitans endofungorum]
MPFVTMLAEPVYGHLTRWEVYERMPTYDMSNTERAIAATGGIQFPYLDQTLLQKYLDFWKHLGNY